MGKREQGEGRETGREDRKEEYVWMSELMREGS